MQTSGSNVPSVQKPGLDRPHAEGLSLNGLLADTDRIGVSRLDRIAQILNVDPAFFSDDQPCRWNCEPDQKRIDAFLETREGQALVSHFMTIPDPALRSRLLALILSISAFRPS